MTTCWVNGVENAQVPADDRGLQFGDGVFRTCLVWDGRVHELEMQLDRLHRDADLLGIRVDSDRLLPEIQTAAEALGEGVLKIMLTRLQSGRGYRPQWPADARRVLLTAPLAEREAGCWSRGIGVCLLDHPRVQASRISASKHLNRLVQVLAQRVVDASAADEAVLLNEQGRVASGSMSTLFLVDHANALRTPGVGEGALDGCTRTLVMNQANARGVPVREGAIALDDLAAAQEVFVVNSLVGLWPVRQFSHPDPGTGQIVTRRYDVPGPMTAECVTALAHPLLQRMLAAGDRC